MLHCIMMQWFLCLDLEELLHQLGVGWEGATNPHDRKRRSLTGSSQKGPRLLQDGCNHETGGISRDWAEVRLRQLLLLLYSELRIMITLLQTACRQCEAWFEEPSPHQTNLSVPFNLIRYVFQPISWWIFLLWILICQFPRSTSDKFAQPSFSSC